MTNFEFLKDKKEYKLFARSAIEAEIAYTTSPGMCAVGCRKALEMAVKWVYDVDKSLTPPYQDNLSSLVYDTSFKTTVEPAVWKMLPYIVKLGNIAVHTNIAIKDSDAVTSLKALYDFILWIDYCYGNNYEERVFDERLIPKNKLKINIAVIKKQKLSLEEKDEEIKKLRDEIRAKSKELNEQKQHNIETRNLKIVDLKEDETRKKYIDLDLMALGWKFNEDVLEEYPLDDMNGEYGKKGRADYVLMGRDGIPLAVIEAKRTSRDPKNGQIEAELYADCLERKFHVRPFIFTTNGFETWFWDDTQSPIRKVSSIFAKKDLEKLMNRRNGKKNLNEVPINDKITDRYYQKEAIRAVCDNINAKSRKSLLVMATGTGKTRTASSLTDVLSRAGYITNVLFLADRTALVKQARDDFKTYLPEMSLCNLCENKTDKNARIVFSTYPTILNAIDNLKSDDDTPMYTPAHFDLIIIDESHRSIFKKYKVIFDYFDALLVGLTATPKCDVNRNTYEFFELEHNVPTYAYDYETAVNKDGVLVPYYNYEVETKFIDEGITYDDLSDEDKQRYEDDFAEDGYMPAFIPNGEINKKIFNQDTIQIVLQDLMERGIKIEGGNKVGKTIIFAQNKKHADVIVSEFDKLYPHLKGKFCRRIICEDSYAQTIIDDFKNPNSNPYIAVSVDMMDTGIDVPECVNLVFFKKIRSKTKFWQMIGRGTRLCPDLTCMDTLDGEYKGKKRFLIFDYCGNFEYFRVNPNGLEDKIQMTTLGENIFIKRVNLIMDLQGHPEFNDFRNELIETCHKSVTALNPDLTSVKIQRKYTEKYSNIQNFNAIGELERDELIKNVAPLISADDNDEPALRFDNLVYSIMLSKLNSSPRFKQEKKQIITIAETLQGNSNIPQINAKIDYINLIPTDDFWHDISLMELEKVRKEIRELIKFILVHFPTQYIITDLNDTVVSQREGETLDPAYDFEDYRKKVNRYIEEHGDTLVIHKLKKNMPLTQSDYNQLEKILTQELGTKQDYEREYGDTPFGLLVRKIAKLDRDAAMEAFSQFINDESLNQKQIVFLNKIIDYVVQNGYIDDFSILQKPPFDNIKFIKIFDKIKRQEIINSIAKIKENAINIIA